MDNCPEPRLCVKLGWHVHGKAWQIWNGQGIDRAEALRIRSEWMLGRLPTPEEMGGEAPVAVQRPARSAASAQRPRPIAARRRCCGK